MNGDDTRKLTIKEAAQMALDVQDACNLSGVVHSFSRVMSLLSDEANRIGLGTDWKNTHPIAVLFSDKIASLTGSNGGFIAINNAYSAAYAAAQEFAKGE